MSEHKPEQETMQSSEMTEEQIEQDFESTSSQSQEEVSSESEHMDDVADNENHVNEDTSEIERLKKENEDLQTRLLRVQADYENFKRRKREEKLSDKKYRAQSLAEDLLPVLDNFERALGTEAETENAKTIKEGVEMVYRQLMDALNKEGIEEIDAANQPFDPNYHQAVMQVDSPDHEENTVVEVLQKGFILNGRVIRPSMVKVSS